MRTAWFSYKDNSMTHSHKRSAAAAAPYKRRLTFSLTTGDLHSMTHSMTLSNKRSAMQRRPLTNGDLRSPLQKETCIPHHIVSPTKGDLHSMTHSFPYKRTLTFHDTFERKEPAPDKKETYFP